MSFQNPGTTPKSAKCTLLASRVSRAAQMDDMQVSCGWGHGRAGVSSSVSAPRSRELEVVLSWFRNLDPYVSPGSSLISKEPSLLQK